MEKNARQIIVQVNKCTILPMVLGGGDTHLGIWMAAVGKDLPCYKLA